jgi:hypothetical protein
MADETQFEVGQRVIDDKEDGEVLIVETTETPADEYVVIEFDGLTVADCHNTSEFDDDSVVVGYYTESLDMEFGSGWLAETVVQRHRDGEFEDTYPKNYAFPVGRLSPVEDDTAAAVPEPGTARPASK